MKRFFSHSEFYLWNRDRQKYIDRYVKGIEEPKTRPMILGTIIHKTIEEPRYPWLQEMKKEGFDYDEIYVVRKLLNKVKRPPKSEVTFTTKDEDLSLITIFDGLDKENKILYEYKTSKRDWTQYQVDTNTQLSFYAYVWQKLFHSYFSDIILFSLNTEKGTIKTFHTTRGPKDIWDIKEKIEKTHQEMKSAGIWEKRLSRQDKILQSNLTIF